MPTYEFECEKCNHVFEDLLKIDQRNFPLIQPCPNCKEKKSIKAVLGAPTLVSPNAISGLRKPKEDFVERMKKIKKEHKGTNSVKDY
jgi:putative FmdB family regulatory protein